MEDWKGRKGIGSNKEMPVTEGAAATGGAGEGSVGLSETKSWNNVMAAQMGGESGEEWMHLYIWLSPFAVHWNCHNAVDQLDSSTK